MATTKTKYRKTRKNLQVPVKGLEAIVKLAEKNNTFSHLPKFKGGDTIRVHVRIKEGEKERIQAYEGVVIGLSNRGSNRTFVVRKISHGVGVERIFTESSPKIAKLEIVQEGRVRRAKMYYLRDLQGKAAKIDRDMDAVIAPATPAPVAATKATTKK